MRGRGPALRLAGPGLGNGSPEASREAFQLALETEGGYGSETRAYYAIIAAATALNPANRHLAAAMFYQALIPGRGNEPAIFEHPAEPFMVGDRWAGSQFGPLQGAIVPTRARPGSIEQGSSCDASF
ncbi:MAG: hypothetical protein AMXMBFR33_41550 [Candidatus Xenobia bacterium]